MRTIGLIGGMSWESTLLYYQIINRQVSQRLGGLHSARILMHSLDFGEVVRGQRAGDWDALGSLLVNAARGLESAGADCLLICTNTMHKLAAEVGAAVRIPLLHIADVTGRAIQSQGLSKVSLLGTCYTIEQPFYTEHLASMCIECIVPPAAQRDEVHRIIFEELCLGQVLERSRKRLRGIAAEQMAAGAQGVILGCTELPLIIGDEQLGCPSFDTTRLHAQAAVDFAVSATPEGP